MLVDFVRHVPFERGTLPAWVGTPRCMSFGNITLVGCTHDNSNNDNTTIPNKNANVGATIVTTSRSSSSFIVRCIARHRRRCRRIVVVAASAGMASSCFGRTLVGGGQFYRRTERCVVVVVVVISVSRRRWQASVREPRRHGRCATPATRTAVRVNGRWAAMGGDVSGRGPSMSDRSSGSGLRWSPK
jgi:hypothetical protein